MTTVSLPTTTKTTTSLSPNFLITDRVLAVNRDIVENPLRDAATHRACHSDMPESTFFEIRRRLKRAGFAYAPEQQNKARRSVSGSLPEHLAATPLGVQLHRAFFANPVPNAKMYTATDDNAWNYMRHLHISDTTSLHYQQGAATVPNLTYRNQAAMWLKFAPARRLHTPLFKNNDEPLMASDFIANISDYSLTKPTRVPLHLAVKRDWSIKLSGQDGLYTNKYRFITHPDDYFGHTYNGRDFAFFRESDNRNETIIPGKQIRQSELFFQWTSILHKYITYITSYQERVHRKLYGITGFRVITDTPTPKRRTNITRGIREFCKKHKINIPYRCLLFFDRETLAQYDNNPYHPDFYHYDVDDQPVHILGL